MVRAAKRRRILVIENDISMQKLLHSLLTANGYRSMTAVGADAARCAVEEEPDGFCLAIIDFAPGLNATAVTRALRRHPAFGLQPILGLTSSTRPEDIEHVLSAGCDAYLRKPFHLEEFQDVIVSLIQGGPAGASCTESTERLTGRWPGTISGSRSVNLDQGGGVGWR